MKIGETEIREIQIVTDENELIATVTDKDIVEKSGYKVACVPIEV